MKKRLFSVILSLGLVLGMVPMMAPPVLAADVPVAVTGGNITFDAATGTVTGCDDSVTAANIPEEIYGVKVTAIGDYAFNKKKNLASVTIPSTVTSLGAFAFGNCPALTSVMVPGSVKEMEGDVFRNCTSMTSAVLQPGVPMIARGMFENCSQLQSVSIPDSVTEIGDFAFWDCISLKSVTIPSGVTSIGQTAFDNCRSLTSVTIPGSVKEIRYSTFQLCQNLQRVVLEEGVEKICFEAFTGCHALKSVSFPDSLKEIEHNAFQNCDALTEAAFGSGLKTLGSESFRGCTKLAKISLPKGIESINHNAFKTCTDLANVYYSGDLSDWSAVKVESGNDDMTTANLHLNSTFIASDWAIDEIKKADLLGLIPDRLIGEDLTKPITRSEFAAVSVKVYENLSGSAALPAVTNPFADTRDVEVLKAYNVGITNGTSATTFGPNELLNREMCATMLTRVFKRATMPGWTLAGDSGFTLSYRMPTRFADDANISGWAKDSVYFMAANGIINGVGNNRFAPRNTTSSEEAQGYANATREQALAIAVRMVENLN